MSALRLHRLVAVALVFFILPHLAGHLAGLAGQAGFDSVQAALRPLYRNPVIEPVLLALIVLQMLLGLRLGWRKWRQGPRGSLQRWQLASGIVLGLFVLQHLLALAGARWLAGLDTTYWWPASVASQWPFALYFWPYYFFGVLAFFGHAGIGLSLALRRRGHARAARIVVQVSVAGGAVLSAAILAGISGLVHPVILPPEWQAYLAALLP